MKVLVADKVAEHTIASLKSLGVEVRYEPDLKAEQLSEAVSEANVLVVRSKKVTAATIQAGPRLALVVRAGVGVDTIDVAAASARGIYVANCPGRNADAVAELAIGLLIAADRRIVEASVALREGKWKKGEFGKARGLKGRTLGIAGFGTIGQATARRALGLEIKVVAWSRSLTPEKAERAGVAHAATLADLARASDAVSVHLAATEETRHLIGPAFFEALRPGAIFINTSRGDVVDAGALRKAIADRKLRVGLDVYEGEPAGSEAAFPDTDLARAAACCTPHVGASTDQASEAIAEEAVRIVKSFLETGSPANAVNICGRSPARYTLVVRHFDRVGVLAGVLDGLREDGVNLEEIQNTVFEGAQAACCTLFLDSEPTSKTLEAIRANPDILQVTLSSRGGPGS
jgi:D-3-phosphoglycerate dehydrogenase